MPEYLNIENFRLALLGRRESPLPDTYEPWLVTLELQMELIIAFPGKEKRGEC